MTATLKNHRIASDYPITGESNSRRHDDRLALRDQLRQGRPLEHPEVGFAHGLPPVVDGTGFNLRALGPAEDTARPPGEVLDRFDNVEQRDVLRVADQAEAAAQSFLRRD